MRGMCVCVCAAALHTCHVNFVSSPNIQSINNIASFGSNFTCCSRRALLLLVPLLSHLCTVTVSLYHSFSYSLCTSHFITLLNYVLTLFLLLLLLLYLTLTFVNCWLTLVGFLLLLFYYSQRLSSSALHITLHNTHWETTSTPRSIVSSCPLRLSVAHWTAQLARHTILSLLPAVDVVVASIVAEHSGCVRRFRQTKWTASANSFIKLIAHKLNKQFH